MRSRSLERMQERQAPAVANQGAAISSENAMYLINATPHDINIVADDYIHRSDCIEHTFEKGDYVIRGAGRPNGTGSLHFGDENGITRIVPFVGQTTLSRLTNSDRPPRGARVIVSAAVAPLLVRRRPDLTVYSPDTSGESAIKKDGKIIGVRRLIRWSRWHVTENPMGPCGQCGECAWCGSAWEIA